MLQRALIGLAAGAAGTAVLNVITYLDMLVRARPSSSVPAKTVEELAESAGVEIEAERQQGTKSRRTAAGALSGYATGIGLGGAYAVLEDPVPDLPLPVSAVIMGAAAMVASDVPATLTGATNPAKWSRAGWLADIVPHFGYGLATVAVYRALRAS